MLQEEFGKLLRELRREHSVGPGEPWTQSDMADRLTEALLKLNANLEEGNDRDIKDFKVISSIERGKRNLSPRELVAYAEALRLTSRERIEFFLGSCGLDSTNRVHESESSKAVLTKLLQRRVASPAFILDQYCDVIAANEAVLALFDLKGELSIQAMVQKHSHFGFNMLQYVFSDEAVEHFKDRMSYDKWLSWTYHNIMMFRSSTLRYRMTNYYKQLFDSLWEHPTFRSSWNAAYDHQEDYFINTEEIFINTSDGCAISFFLSTTTAITAKGELHYCVYVPTTRETQKYFSQLLDKTDLNLMKIAPWPNKKE